MLNKKSYLLWMIMAAIIVLSAGSMLFINNRKPVWFGSIAVGNKTVQPEQNKPVTGASAITPPGSKRVISVGNHKVIGYYDNDRRFRFTINGKEYGPYDWDYSYNYATFDGQNFIFPYKSEGGFFVNVNDKIYGPYLELSEHPGLAGGQWYFSYKAADGYYANINGKIVGPYEKLYSYDRAGNIIIQYIKDKKLYVELQNKTYGPYSEFYMAKGCYAGKCMQNYGYMVGEAGGHWYIWNQVSSLTDEQIKEIDKNRQNYTGRDQEFLNVDGRIYGPYDSVSRPLASKDIIAFYYAVGDKTFLNINGKESNAEAIGGDSWGFGGQFQVSEKNYGYVYLSGNDYYVRISENSYGPYDTCNRRGRLMGVDLYLIGSHWIISHCQDGKYVWNIDGKESGSYEWMIEHGASENHWGFTYSKNYPNYQFYANIDGRDYGPYKSIADSGNLKLTKDHWAYMYQDIVGDWYLNTDGKKQGPYNDAVFVSIDPPEKRADFSISDTGWSVMGGEEHPWQ